MSTYSVFIPRVFSNIRPDRITNVFHSLNIGDVEKVDLVAKTGKNGDHYNMAFVHFREMYNTIESQNFCQDVQNPDTKTRLTYEDPWFWLVLPFEKKESPVNVLEEIAYPSQQEIAYPSQQEFPQQEFPQQEFHPVQQMVPFCVMTPNGPMWQWGYPAMPMPMQQATPPPKQQRMTPPQVMYKHNGGNPRRHPRKRLNVPKMCLNDEKTDNISDGAKKPEDGEV